MVNTSYGMESYGRESVGGFEDSRLEACAC